MYTDETFLQAALDSLKKDLLSSLPVAMPGIIESYDADSGLASVQSALRRRTSDSATAGEILTAPLLEQVPVFLPAADCSVSPEMPCLLIFMDFCMDGWLQSGQPVLPPSPRQHDWSDAVALVGCAPAFPGSSSAGEGT